MSVIQKPLEAGAKVPNFQTTDESGCPVSRSNLIGKRYLLYFYPRDNTPGCTLEACGFRDLQDSFKQHDIAIFGVSGCPKINHIKFREKFAIPFPLLMDEDHAIAKSFGAFGEKKFMGKTFNGIHRMSFLVSETGTIIKSYPRVAPKTHPQQILEDLK